MTGMYKAIVISLLALVVALILELVFFKDGPAKKADNGTKADAKAAAGKNETLVSPLKGQAVVLSDVKDEAFSTGVMGQGLAIVPSDGKLYAPCDGTIETFFPTGHAIGITSTKGAEILIHVGMDTVNMEGDGFTPKKKQGDTVKKGDLLLEFDIAKIKKAGYDTTTPIIITNTDDYADVVPVEPKAIAPGDELITLL
jgi:PTS system beta-glucosides-specific IIC component